MPKKPVILNTTVLAQSALFRIEGLDLKFSNGEARCYERICGRSTGSVMIVPLLDSLTILLIREYCAGVDSYLLGFPKGAIEYNEDVALAANRELMEEVGYGANKLTQIGRFTASPGYMDAMMDIFLAQDLYPRVEEGDEPEPIEVIPWSLAEIDKLLAHPEFHEARSIAALLMVARGDVDVKTGA